MFLTIFINKISIYYAIYCRFKKIKYEKKQYKRDKLEHYKFEKAILENTEKYLNKI